MNVVTLVTEHYAEIAAVAVAVYTLASVYVAATPTPKDDELLKNVVHWLSYLHPADVSSTFKTPFSK